MGSDSSSPYLVIRDLHKYFGEFHALQGVDLNISQGELVCFLGPSGCGKTTLLRAIAGLDPQSQGHIIQDGREISHLPPQERDFGIVFQSYALFPNLTVEQNIAYGLVNQKKSKAFITSKVTELLEIIGLVGSEKKYPTQLSGGQQQRVALARALAMSPGLLLLDEPLSALDAKVRLHLRNEIRSLQQKLGVTTILVTHDQEEALAIADKIVILDQGRIEQIGTPTDVYLRPKTRGVAEFIGAMNVIDCVREDDHLTVAGRPFSGISLSNMTSDICSLLVRPEHLAIEEHDMTSSSVFPILVINCEFLGPHSCVTVAHAHDRKLLFKVSLPSDQVLKIGVSTGRLKSLRVDPAHCLLVNSSGLVVGA